MLKIISKVLFSVTTTVPQDFFFLFAELAVNGACLKTELNYMYSDV
jgi:hypothetical protein